MNTLLLDQLNELPTVKEQKVRKWLDRLTPEQLVEYNQILDFVLEQPNNNRPTLAALAELIERRFGFAPSDTTFRKNLKERAKWHRLQKS